MHGAGKDRFGGRYIATHFNKVTMLDHALSEEDVEHISPNKTHHVTLGTTRHINRNGSVQLLTLTSLCSCV